MCMYEPTCGGQRSTLGVFVNLSSPYFWEKVSYWTMLADQEALEICVSTSQSVFMDTYQCA